MSAPSSNIDKILCETHDRVFSDGIFGIDADYGETVQDKWSEFTEEATAQLNAHFLSIAEGIMENTHGNNAAQLRDNFREAFHKAFNQGGE